MSIAKRSKPDVGAYKGYEQRERCLPRYAGALGHCEWLLRRDFTNLRQKPPGECFDRPF